MPYDFFVYICDFNSTNSWLGKSVDGHYIFGRNSKWPPEVRKGSPVKFLEVSYYQKFFQLLTVHKSEDRGGIKMPYDFFVYIYDF